MGGENLRHLTLEVFAVSLCCHTATKGNRHGTLAISGQLVHLLVNLVLLGYDAKLRPQFVVVLAYLLGEQLSVLCLNVGNGLVLIILPVGGIRRNGTEKLSDT